MRLVAAAGFNLLINHRLPAFSSNPIQSLLETTLEAAKSVPIDKGMETIILGHRTFVWVATICKPTGNRQETVRKTVIAQYPVENCSLMVITILIMMAMI